MEEAFYPFLTKVQEQILGPLVALIALAAFIVFIWGMIEFLIGASDEEKRRTGRQHMLWGIIGLAIVFGAQVIVIIIGKIATQLVGTGPVLGGGTGR
jgi:TRAP-type C4-dicarboxylate transport system permease small subunit